MGSDSPPPIVASPPPLSPAGVPSPPPPMRQMCIDSPNPYGTLQGCTSSIPAAGVDQCCASCNAGTNSEFFCPFLRPHSRCVSIHQIHMAPCKGAHFPFLLPMLTSVAPGATQGPFQNLSVPAKPALATSITWTPLFAQNITLPPEPSHKEHQPLRCVHGTGLICWQQSAFGCYPLAVMSAILTPSYLAAGSALYVAGQLTRLQLEAQQMMHKLLVGLMCIRLHAGHFSQFVIMLDLSMHIWLTFLTPRDRV